MILIKLFGLFLICILVSCTEKSPDSELKFNKNEFASLMAEIYLMDAQFSELPGPIKDSILTLKVQDILRAKNLSMDAFLKIQQFYKNNYKEQEGLEKQIIQLVKDSSKNN